MNKTQLNSQNKAKTKKSQKIKNIGGKHLKTVYHTIRIKEQLNYMFHRKMLKNSNICAHSEPYKLSSKQRQTIFTRINITGKKKRIPINIEKISVYFLACLAYSRNKFFCTCWYCRIICGLAITAATAGFIAAKAANGFAAAALALPCCTFCAAFKSAAIAVKFGSPRCCCMRAAGH